MFGKSLLLSTLLATPLASAAVTFPVNGVLIKVDEEQAFNWQDVAVSATSVVATHKGTFEWGLFKNNGHFMTHVPGTQDFISPNEYGYGVRRSLQVDISNWNANRKHLVSIIQPIKAVNHSTVVQPAYFNQGLLYLYCFKANGERVDFASNEWKPLGSSQTNSFDLTKVASLNANQCSRVEIYSQVFAKEVTYYPLEVSIVEVGDAL